MMDKSIFPEGVQNFRRISSDIVFTEELPVSPKNRRITDKYFFIAFISFVLLTISLMVYNLYYSDIRRLGGYDDCGNICGEKNDKYTEWNCTGQDMTNKQILLNGSCIGKDTFKMVLQHAPKMASDFSYKAFSKNNQAIATTLTNETLSFQGFSGKLQNLIYKLILAALISLGLCLGAVLLFRYATRSSVWFILVCPVILLFAFTVCLWIRVYEKGQPVYFAIVITLVWFFFSCVIVFMRKKVPLVILILKESTASIFDMPFMFCVSVLTSIMQVLMYIWVIVSYAWIFASGKLIEENGKLIYTLGAFKNYSLALSTLTVFWSIDYVYGIQYIILSGAVARWYFTKDKSLLENPIRTSTYIAIRFHLGSIAFGSMVILSLPLMKIILHSLTRNAKINKLINWCMIPVKTLLSVLSKSSYIFIAIHGLPFYKAGLKATKLTKLNICNTEVLIYMGSAVIKMAQIVIFTLSVFLSALLLMDGYEGSDGLIFIVLTVFITSFVSSTILGTIETALETIFLCFCEDYAMNDGVRSPYAMSRSLMEFVDSTNKPL